MKLADLIDRMQRWEDDTASRDGTCVKCGELVGGHEPEYEPSPLCNGCAQDLATRAMPSRIRRLETELGRASGVANALGANDYAGDFLRVALDREDFNSEVARR